MRANDGGVLEADAAPSAKVLVADVRPVAVLVVTGDCVTRKQLTTRLIREAAVETLGVAAMVKEGASNETIIAWNGNHHMIDLTGREDGEADEFTHCHITDAVHHFP
jgi:hypothetical protein